MKNSLWLSLASMLLKSNTLYINYIKFFISYILIILFITFKLLFLFLFGLSDDYLSSISNRF